MDKPFQPKTRVTRVRRDGNIILAKELAGQQVIFTEIEKGYWRVHTLEAYQREAASVQAELESPEKF